MRVAFDATAAGLISASQQAELHREIYAAIIKGCTRQRGARGRLAADAGITPQYLSYVLVADTDPGRDPVTRRRAAVKTARRIADALALPEDKRQQAFEHLVSARGRRDGRHVPTTLRRDDLPQLIWAVRRLSERATHCPDPHDARRLYHTVVAAGGILAIRTPVRVWPIEYIELCLCLHDALCVLDNPATALHYARLAEAVLGWVDPVRYRGSEERVRDLQINILRAIGVAYNNLNLPAQAIHYFDKAHQLITSTKPRQGWLVHICRDKLSALAKLSRFTLSEVEGLADQAMREMGDIGIDQGPAALLLKAKLGECYLAFGARRDRAGPLLDQLIVEAENSTTLGIGVLVVMERKRVTGESRREATALVLGLCQQRVRPLALPAPDRAQPVFRRTLAGQGFSSL
jgi:hypothetical protein